MAGVAAVAAADVVGLELVAARLRRLAGSVAEQADLLRVATAPEWHGVAAQSFRAAAEQPAVDLRAATACFSAAADVLAGFVSAVRHLQADARQAARMLQEADELTTSWQRSGVARDDPGAALRHRGSALLAMTNAEFEALAARSAVAFAGLRPPFGACASRQSGGSALASFGGGLGEGLLGLLSLAQRANPATIMLHPQQVWTDARSQLALLKLVATDPVEAGKQVIDWDTWRTDPWRAGGRLVPSVILTAGTGGAGLATRGAATTARVDFAGASLGGPGLDAFVPATLRKGPHRLTDINRAPGGPHFDNCPSCAIAVDQTLAGAPASAIADRAMSVRDLAARYDGMFVMADREWITEQLLDAPSGARGIVFGMRDGREGHVFNAVQENGRVYFVDGQTGAPAVFQESYTSLFFLRTDARTVVGAVAKEPS
jgi:Papain fold toxin 1, glutamine deamidase